MEVKQSKSQLIEQAKLAGIKGYSKMNIAQLKEQLNSKEAEPVISQSLKPDVIQPSEEPKLKTKREPTTWVKALQEYNQSKSSYSIPKKGTPEYSEVAKIQERLKNPQVIPEPVKPEKKPRKQKQT